MKVISIRQPWATLIAQGYKEYEFRTWKTKYRGEILIHASKGIDKEYLKYFEDLNIKEYPTGKIIAKAIITDCIEVTPQFEQQLIIKNKQIYGQSLNRTGYAFKLEHIEEIDNPIEINGQLGLWNYNASNN